MKIIFKSLITLTLFISLTFITTDIHATTPICNPVIDGILGGSQNNNCQSTPNSSQNIIAILLARFFSAALAVGTIFFLVYLVINSVRWLTAGGDSGQIASARDGILNAIIGVTVLASIFAIANFIAPIIGLSSENCQFPAQICWPVL